MDVHTGRAIESDIHPGTEITVRIRSRGAHSVEQYHRGSSMRDESVKVSVEAPTKIQSHIHVQHLDGIEIDGDGACVLPAVGIGVGNYAVIGKTRGIAARRKNRALSR